MCPIYPQGLYYDGECLNNKLKKISAARFIAVGAVTFQAAPLFLSGPGPALSPLSTLPAAIAAVIDARGYFIEINCIDTLYPACFSEPVYRVGQCFFHVPCRVPQFGCRFLVGKPRVCIEGVNRI